MVTLYFIRHGETEANVAGILTGTLETNLTERGVQEAKALSKKLTQHFDAYICSPLKRTWQTLHAIKGEVDFTIDKRVTEVYSGDWQGRKKTALPQEEYALYKKGLFDAPNGEALENVNNRALDFLTDMFSKYTKNEKILIVTHNAFMRQLKRLLVPNSDATEPKNLEIFKVDYKMFIGGNMKRKYYEAYEDRYKKVHSEKKLAWAGEGHSPSIEKILKKYHASKKSTILEIGCGEGQNAIYLLSQGYNVLASDVSPEAIRWCKQKAKEKNVPESQFFVMDILNNTLAEKYDFIYSVAVLHMLVEQADRDKFLSFVHDHLKDKGRAIIVIMGDGVETRKTDTTKAFDLSDREFGDEIIQVATTSCRMVTWAEFLSELDRANLKVLNHYVDKTIAGFDKSMVAEVERK